VKYPKYLDLSPYCTSDDVMPLMSEEVTDLLQQNFKSPIFINKLDDIIEKSKSESTDHNISEELPNMTTWKQDDAVSAKQLDEKEKSSEHNDEESMPTDELYSFKDDGELQADSNVNTWICERCTLVNENEFNHCAACDTPINDANKTLLQSQRISGNKRIHSELSNSQLTPDRNIRTNLSLDCSDDMSVFEIKRPRFDFVSELPSPEILSVTDERSVASVISEIYRKPIFDAFSQDSCPLVSPDEEQETKRDEIDDKVNVDGDKKTIKESIQIIDSTSFSQYQLTAVVRHVGSQALSGHYICDRLALPNEKDDSQTSDERLNRQWRRCNDSSIYSISEVISKTNKFSFLFLTSTFITINIIMVYTFVFRIKFWKIRNQPIFCFMNEFLRSDNSKSQMNHILNVRLKHI
jgi:hypothetical protein